MVKSFKLKKDDNVIVIAGKYKGKQGTITKSIPKEGKVIVSGVNIAKKHAKQSAESAGGVIEKLLPIHASNVAYIDSTDGKPTKVGYKVLESGEKVRISRKSGKQID